MAIIFRDKFEPVVDIGDNVAIMYDVDESRWIYGRVVYVEPLKVRIFDLGPLPASTAGNIPAKGTKKTLEEIRVGINEFAQIRLGVVDDFIAIVYQPTNVPKSAYVEGPVPASPLDTLEAGGMSEYFITENIVLTLEPFNPLFVAQELARIKISGYRYIFERLSSRPDKFTRIPVAGVSPTPSPERPR